MFFILVSFLLAEPLHRVPDTTNVYRQFDPAVLAVASSADLARKYAENLQKAPGQIDGGWVEDYKGYRVFLAGYRNFVEKAAEQLIALFKEHVLQPQRLAREKNEKRKISDEETEAREKIAGEESYGKSQIAIHEFEARRKIIVAQEEQYERCALREEEERNLSAIFQWALDVPEGLKNESKEGEHTSQSSFDAPSSDSWFRLSEADQYSNPGFNIATVAGFTLEEVIFCATLSDTAYKIAKKTTNPFRLTKNKGTAAVISFRRRWICFAWRR